MRPRLSVVIPVYNGSHDLELCLQALRASETTPQECIVVDDGSTDNSAEIAAQYGVKVLSTGGRGGPAKARNMGVQAATVDGILFLDSDCCVYPDTISKIVAEFAADARLDAIM